MKVIKNGTKVLILYYSIRWMNDQPIDDYEKGVVISSKLSDKYVFNNKRVRIYTVLGEDGKEYTGPYGVGIETGEYFRTPEDHIKSLKKIIEYNKEAIKTLEEENQDHENTINSIENDFPKLELKK